ncbi:uncharacterized protein TNCV_763191 [Trichonephila clavipes]|nr:uncharacterized protein TNCV_763191 [Trichonephila clavipes]
MGPDINPWRIGYPERGNIICIMYQYSTRTLNILQLNINATQKKIEELTEILNVNKVHIACLQETKLKPNLKLKIKGFTTLRKDRKDRSGGGLAFLVKSADIKFREISLPPTTDYDVNSTKVQAITALLPQRGVTIINAYHPDNSDINLDLFNTLLDTKSDTKILLGDLNAKNPSWGSRTLDLKGSQIEYLLCDNDLSILNDKRSTYLSKTNGTTSTLDITAIKGTRHLFSIFFYLRVLKYFFCILLTVTTKLRNFTMKNS